MTRTALVAGGSIGGLFAAAALLRAGWRVDVLERTGVELSGRGAGIVTHDALIAALQAVGASTQDLGVAVQTRVAFDRNGERVAELPFPQIVTSWDRIHSVLRAVIPEAAHHLGAEITGYAQDGLGVTARLSDGSTRRADLLVGADGFRSAIRAQMLPEVQPAFSGYVVWRALTREADLSPELQRAVFPHFSIYAPTGTQIVGYPIAGPGNNLAEGQRRYNFVWYARVGEAALQDMLTDASGKRHAVSIPPPLVRQEVLAAMERDAAERLPPPFVEILRASERPFFTPIYDHHSPAMAEGRVALAGDAACVARPHIGMGVTKAALDALALARHLGDGSDVTAGLAGYSAERVPASRVPHDVARRLAGYIFPPEGTAANPDGRSNPHLDEILRVTASVAS